MKKGLIIVIIGYVLVSGCNPKMTKQEEKNTFAEQSSFYDLYYQEILNNSKTPNIKNIDSLYELKNLKNHWIWLKEKTGIDSLDLKRITMVQKISVSDTLKVKLKQKTTPDLSKSGVAHSFSKPYVLSKNQSLIFWESNFYNVSRTSGVAFFSKKAKNQINLDSCLTLYNSSIK
jgi:hypothetical protein